MAQEQADAVPAILNSEKIKPHLSPLGAELADATPMTLEFLESEASGADNSFDGDRAFDRAVPGRAGVPTPALAETVPAQRTPRGGIGVRGAAGNSLQQFYQNATQAIKGKQGDCLLYTSPSPRDQRGSRMPSSA